MPDSLSLGQLDELPPLLMVSVVPTRNLRLMDALHLVQYTVSGMSVRNWQVVMCMGNLCGLDTQKLMQTTH